MERQERLVEQRCGEAGRRMDRHGRHGQDLNVMVGMGTARSVMVRQERTVMDGRGEYGIGMDRQDRHPVVRMARREAGRHGRHGNNWLGASRQGWERQAWDGGVLRGGERRGSDRRGRQRQGRRIEARKGCDWQARHGALKAGIGAERPGLAGTVRC